MMTGIRPALGVLLMKTDVADVAVCEYVAMPDSRRYRMIFITPESDTLMMSLGLPSPSRSLPKGAT